MKDSNALDMTIYVVAMIQVAAQGILNGHAALAFAANGKQEEMRLGILIKTIGASTVRTSAIYATMTIIRPTRKQHMKQ